MRGDFGGFVHIGQKNDRLDLQKLLNEYEHIDKTRDKYTEEDRDIFSMKPIVTYANNEERSAERTRVSLELAEFKKEAAMQREEVSKLKRDGSNLSGQQSHAPHIVSRGARSINMSPNLSF